MSEYDRCEELKKSDYDSFLSDYDRWFYAIQP